MSLLVVIGSGAISALQTRVQDPRPTTALVTVKYGYIIMSLSLIIELEVSLKLGTNIRRHIGVLSKRSKRGRPGQIRCGSAGTLVG